MNVVPVNARPLAELAAAMRHGRPWLPEGTDYWLWRECFGDTSFLAIAEGAAVGGILACVHQAQPQDLYIDQVAVDPAWRGQGVTRAMFAALEAAARERGCVRLWLSTDPANPATRAWPRVGFASLGLQKSFKGPGKDRELFERRL